MAQNHPFTRFWQSPAVRRTRHFASPKRWFRYLTAPHRRLPTFVIAGAQKAGTTSLFGYLAAHPQCLPALSKEVNFFDQNYARGERWYRMHFPIARPTSEPGPAGRQRTACFEASPHYMFEPKVPARASQSLPGMKAIFLLRNPVSRAYSHYHHEVRRGREVKPFEECVDLEIRQRSGRAPHSSAVNQHSAPTPGLSYLQRGLYVNQLLNWRTYFPAEQMLVIEAERMFTVPREVFEEVLAFLHLDRWMPAQFGNLNPGRYQTPMSASARERATHYFAPHNERLFEFLGTRYAWR